MLPYCKLISEILISINILNNTSLPLKEPTLDNTYIVDKKLPSKSEMFYPLTTFPKEPLFLISKKELETEELIPELPELTLLLLDTPKTD